MHRPARPHMRLQTADMAHSEPTGRAEGSGAALVSDSTAFLSVCCCPFKAPAHTRRHMCHTTTVLRNSPQPCHFHEDTAALVAKHYGGYFVVAFNSGQQQDVVHPSVTEAILRQCETDPKLPLAIRCTAQPWPPPQSPLRPAGGGQPLGAYADLTLQSFHRVSADLLSSTPFTLLPHRFFSALGAPGFPCRNALYLRVGGEVCGGGSGWGL